MTRDTVLLETPASFAMSWMVVALAMGELVRLTWILGKPANSLIDLKTVSIELKQCFLLVFHPRTRYFETGFSQRLGSLMQQMRHVSCSI